MGAPSGRSGRRLPAILLRTLSAIASVAAGTVLVSRGFPPGLAVLTVIGAVGALLLLHRSAIRRRPHRQSTPVGGCHQIAARVLEPEDEAGDAGGIETRDWV